MHISPQIFTHCAPGPARPITHCVARPAEFDGARLWMSGATVTEDGIDAGGIAVRCIGLPADLAPGDSIAFSGTFRAPSTIVIDRTRRAGGFAHGWVLYAVSAVTLLAIGACFFKQFRPVEPSL